VIEVQHLTKRYGPFTAVQDVSFRVERGEILGFLGPNGAGKTTTMRILTGYMPATEGKAIVAGFDVFDQPIEAKRRTGYLPETPPLYPDMTIREYLTFVAKIKGVPPGERRDRIKEDHGADADRRHGQPAVRAIVERLDARRPGAGAHSQPRRLILDEPTAGLDPKQIIETRQLIKELAGDHGDSEHPHPAGGFADLPPRGDHQQGHVVAVDTPDNLTARLRGSETLYVQVDAAGQDITASLSHVPGIIRVAESDRHGAAIGYEVESERGQDIRRELARAVVNGGWGLLELRPMRMSLEEIFLSLTTEDAGQMAAGQEAISA
jgi:ABC-2 type transport system ATP-binding protein